MMNSNVVSSSCRFDRWHHGHCQRLHSRELDAWDANDWTLRNGLYVAAGRTRGTRGERGPFLTIR